MDQGLQNVAKDYMDKVARTHGDLKGYLDHASAQIVGGMDEATNKLADRLSTTNTQFLTGLDQTANQLFTQLNAAGSGLAGKVEETTNRLFSEIGQKATQINLKLDETSTGVFDRLDLQANYVNSHIEETASSFTAISTAAPMPLERPSKTMPCASLMPSICKATMSTTSSAKPLSPSQCKTSRKRLTVYVVIPAHRDTRDAAALASSANCSQPAQPSMTCWSQPAAPSGPSQGDVGHRRPPDAGFGHCAGPEH